MNLATRAGGVVNLVLWSRLPRSVSELYVILEDTKDEELVEVMTVLEGPGSQLAWAEYGRRKYGVPFAVQEGEARPYHYTPSPIWS